MNKHNIQDFIRGWLVGDFEPSLVQSKDIEVAIQYYKAGDHEPKHIHKIAREITVIAYGRVTMSGTEYVKGDIVDIPPGAPTDFVALEDTATVVIKTPSAPSDKYLVD